MAQYLHISVLLVCLYDALIMLLLPSSATINLGLDGGAARFITACTAIVITVYILFKNGFNRLPNIWMGLLLIFIVFASFHGPHINFDSEFIPQDPGLYNFKPMFECLLYFGLFMAMYSVKITRENKYKIFNAIALVGIIYSVYCICQAFGMDQIYKVSSDFPVSSMSRNPNVGGFIGQPVFTAVLLAMCFPFILRHKPAWAGINLLAIGFTGNHSVWIAIAIISLFLLTGRSSYALKAVCVYIAILGLLVAFNFVYPKLIAHISTTGRVDSWTAIIKDFVSPAFPGIHKSYVLTGFGIGSFSVLFPFYHNSQFYQAHNELLEVFYTLSFIGLFLFVRMVKDVFEAVTDQCIFAALLGITVCSMTNPVWHIPQLQFLTVFLMGLAYNKEQSNAVGTIN